MRAVIQENLQLIRRQIAPYTPNIIAVTKYFDHRAIEEAYKAGLRDFGENRVLEAIEKFQHLDEAVKNNSKFHLIGHLQSKKVKKAVGVFDLIHSVDSLKLAEAIDSEASGRGIVQNVLIQINNAKEEQKSGFYPEDIVETFSKLLELNNIRIIGLMNMAPANANEDELKRLFCGIRKLKEDLEKEFEYPMPELSMGMSSDYKIAVECGATMIRIGRKLFSDNAD